ncbi:MAG: hypothetical protein ACP5E5_14795 [Acidobacteriaceae bacterium]
MMAVVGGREATMAALEEEENSAAQDEGVEFADEVMGDGTSFWRCHVGLGRDGRCRRSVLVQRPELRAGLRAGWMRMRCRMPAWGYPMIGKML